MDIQSDQSAPYELDDRADADPYGYQPSEEDIDPFDEEYRSQPGSRTAEVYRSMLDEDWVEGPLRDLLETRLDAMHEG